MKTTAWLVFIFLSSLVLRAADGDNQKPFDLTTLRGETFQNCRIVKTTPEGITILHERGVTRISFENLNDEWKKRFDYSPEKSKAFQKVEAARLALAEEKQRQSKPSGAPTTPESQRIMKLQEAIAQQQADAAAAVTLAAVSLPGLMIPVPGDSTAYFSTGILALRTSIVSNANPTVPSTTESLVPATTPITQIYTPDTTGGQHYIINQGAVFTPGDGTIYYVNPGYTNPGYIAPVYRNPPIIICPPVTVRPSFPIAPTPIIRSSTTTTVRVGP